VKPPAVQSTFGFAKPKPAAPNVKADGPPCLSCGADTVIGPGVGPHFARADCRKCGAWRWLPKPRPDGRGGAA
jgi:hypothetical protein